MKNYWKVFLSIFCLSSLCFSSCFKEKKEEAPAVDISAQIQAAKQKRENRVLNWGLEDAPTTLDPAQTATLYGYWIVGAIYDTLYEYKFLKIPFEVKPRLALALPEVSEDGLTYTIKIKPGVFYTDDPAFPGGKGREVVVGDLVYSIKRLFDPKTLPEGAWLFQGRIQGIDEWKTTGSDYNKEVEGLKIIDNYTLQIGLNAPYPQLTYALTTSFASFVPREVVDHYGNQEFMTHPVGSGPFQLLSFTKKKAVFKKNPRYREEVMDLEGYDESIHGPYGIKRLEGRKIPFVNNLEINFMLEEGAWWNSFTKGNEVKSVILPIEQVKNVVETLDPLKLKPEYADKYYARLIPEFEFRMVRFQMDNPEIGYNKDKKREARNQELRCAIRDVYNWPEEIERFWNNLGIAFPGVLFPGMDGYDPTISQESVTLNVERAKERLKKAGWNAGNLPVLTVDHLAKTREAQFYERFRGTLLNLGYPKNKIKSRLHTTFGDINKAQNLRKTMIWRMGWGYDYPDAENAMQLFYGPNKAPSSNATNYNDPAFNAMYDQIKVMQPSPERTELYKQMNQNIIDSCNVISGFARSRIYMWHKDVIAYEPEKLLGNFLKYVEMTD